MISAKEIISGEGLAVLADFLSVTECLLTAPLYEIPRKPSFLSPCPEVRGFPPKSLCNAALIRIPRNGLILRSASVKNV